MTPIQPGGELVHSSSEKKAGIEGSGIGAASPARWQVQPDMTHNSTVNPAASGRVAALDFTKGALVVIMVVYHWLNYFISVQGTGYRYLRFLTPSFIFITGFFVSYVYLRKYRVGELRLSKRLLDRGVKLAAVFVALNLIIGLSVRTTNSSPLTDWHLYVYGMSASGKAAFSVLLPISYLLILSAGLALLARVWKSVFHVACVGSIAAAVIMDFYGTGNGNLQLLSIGLLGTSTGFVSIDKINRLTRHPWLLVLAYAGYIAALSLWTERYTLQVAGVCLSLLLIYTVGCHFKNPASVRGVIDLMGRYSLFGYIMQIVILQVLARVAHRLGFNYGIRAACFVLALGLTIASVELADWARARNAAVNRLYSAVFA